MKISNKIFISEAIELMGWQLKPLDYVIHALLNDEVLTGYFDVNVRASIAPSGYHKHPGNEEDETLYVHGPPPRIIEGPGKIILEADVETENSISVFRFEHDGTSYCGADDEGTNLKPIVLNFESIYFDKSEIHTLQDLPPYQDKNHEHYAPEIDLAIQLHKAIYIDGYRSHDPNREARITSWLNKKYPEKTFPDNAIKRLSAVIATEKPKK